MTPDSLAIEIIRHFNPWGSILDPARGAGAFYNNYTYNLRKDWCEVSEGRDFKDYTGKVHWIITNPPWSQLPFYLEKGMTVADDIVYLAPITNFVTKRRLRLIKDSHYGIYEIYGVDTPAKPWPQSGFQLAAVHIKRYYSGPIGLSGTLQ